MTKKASKYFLIALSVIILDQVIKFIVKFNMELREEIKVIGDVVKIHFIENKGAAFGLTVTNLANGLGFDMSEETGKLILSLFSIVAVIAIGVVLYRMADHKSPLPVFVALIFGGAMGNIIDRTFYGMWFSHMNNYDGGLFHGRVVDMFYFDIWSGYLPEFLGGGYYNLWPIFNIADSAISVGIVIILIFQGKFFKMDEQARGIGVETATAAAATATATPSPAEPTPAPTPESSEKKEEAGE